MNSLSSDQVHALLASSGREAVVYLIGAGGCGMSGLGHLLLDLGHRVAGSDLVLNEEVRQLNARGAQIFAGHADAQLAEVQPHLVVYSSAIRSNNPELLAAQQQQIPIIRRAVLLAALLHRQRGICVAGMHGKTTTTALLAYVLDQLGEHPSYAVGAQVPQLDRPARFAPEGASGVAPYFVIEADESDGTLREFRPEFAIVLNVDEEHMDYYANLEAVCREFQDFAGQTRQALVFCADDARLSELLARRPGALSYGYHSLATYRLSELKLGSEGSVFQVWKGGACLGEFQSALLGEKNASNAGAVIALLHHLGFAPGRIAEAIASFRGAARRQEELFRDERFRVFNDYGHHPSEIRPTLQALQSLGGRRLLVAFQPHRFSRTQFFLDQFATCFSEADRLWITEVYAASEAEISGVNGRRLTEAIRAHGQSAEFVPTLEDLRESVRAALTPGDVVLFLGAGDITRAAHALAAQLRTALPEPRERVLARWSAGLSAEAVVRTDEPLAKRTTLRVGGRADYYVEPASEKDLSLVLQSCRELHLPFLVLGRGSNLLIRDGGIRGVVICLGHPAFSRLEMAGEHLHCGAGVKLKTLAVEARRHGLAGLEFLEGIPGSVGGALRMNAGAMGSWIFEIVERIRFMDCDGQAHERPASEVHVEYRGCPLFKNHIALGAVLKGQSAPPEVIAARMQTFSQKRWNTQPAQPSAGCIFKNPQVIPAGRLIEELGLKGARVGGAKVSEVHGNFIVNEGHATATDVLRLIEEVKQRAKAERGIDLETEVEILGENPA